MRVDLYTNVHKAQRFALFQLGQDIGKTCFQDPKRSAETIGKIQEMFSHLRDHATNEEKYIHPLYAKIGKPAEALEAKHHELEQQLENLERLVEKGTWDQIYTEYNRFLSQYLAHLNEEEEAQKNVLWPAVADADLVEVFTRFKKERAPQAAMKDLELMFRAMSSSEVTQILKAMKSGPGFQMACDIAKASLDEALWKEVTKAIK